MRPEIKTFWAYLGLTNVFYVASSFLLSIVMAQLKMCDNCLHIYKDDFVLWYFAYFITLICIGKRVFAYRLLN